MQRAQCTDMGSPMTGMWGSNMENQMEKKPACKIGIRMILVVSTSSILGRCRDI